MEHVADSRIGLNIPLIEGGPSEWDMSMVLYLLVVISHVSCVYYNTKVFKCITYTLVWRCATLIRLIVLVSLFLFLFKLFLES